MQTNIPPNWNPRALPRLRSALMLALAVAFAGFAPAQPPRAQAASVVTVSPINLNGWMFWEEQPTGAGSFVPGPDTAPLGAGSARMTLDATGRELLQTQAYSGTMLSLLTRLEYSTYRSSADVGKNLAISLQLDIDYNMIDANTAWQGRLVYEPYHTVGVAGTVEPNTWRSWNPLAADAKWWASQAPGNALCPQSTPCTWAQVLGYWPNAGIRNASPFTGFVAFKAGGPWANFDGNVDAVTIGLSDSDTTYDFEPEPQCTTTCYIDGASGNDSYGGASPSRAKKTIQAGVNQVAVGGAVVVAAGLYTEQVTIQKSVKLTGAGAGSTTIKAPATLPPSSNPDSAIVLVKGSSTTAEISGFSVAGPGPSACGSIGSGIFVRDNATANIHHNSILNIRDEPLGGCQNGVGILVGRQSYGTIGTATIANNQIEGYQKGGIAVSNAGSSATITGNTVTGAGPTVKIAQNGIQVSGGATATLSGNTVVGHSYTPYTFVSTGILLQGSNADTNGNTLSENQVGIYHIDGSGTHDGNTVSASSAGTGSPGFWGIIADDPPAHRQPVPFDGSAATRPTAAPARSAAQAAPAEQVVVVKNNVLTSDSSSAGVGLEADAGFGALDINFTATNNTIQNWGSGVVLFQCTSGCTTTTFANVEVNLNSITGNIVGLDNTAAPGAAVDAERNWWGQPSGPTNTGNMGGTGDPVSGDADFSPWLCDGTDTSPATGFQPNPGAVCGGAAPDTWITAQPANPSSSTTATFAFTGTDDFTPPASLTFECQLDGAGFAACTSDQTYNSLALGSHTFEVRAKDPQGEMDSSPATYTWTVVAPADTTAPDTTIGSKPANPSNSATATFTFDGTDNVTPASLIFECQLDGASFMACTSGKTYTGLANGSHTFQVRARDAAGNVDPTPAIYTWTVAVTTADTTAPDTTIGTKPASPSSSATATFTFNGTDNVTPQAGLTFECRLDGAAFAPCSGSKTYSGLRNGVHTFQVRAKDAAGNVDQTPATYSWTVKLSYSLYIPMIQR